MTDRELMQQALNRELMQLALNALDHGLAVERADAMKALRERLAEPEQKPVAQRLSNGTIDVLGGVIVPIGALLYLVPPQRKPLTEDEIATLLSQSVGVDIKLNGGDVLFARAIERAHGIGEKE